MLLLLFAAAQVRICNMNANIGSLVFASRVGAFKKYNFPKQKQTANSALGEFDLAIENT